MKTVFKFALAAALTGTLALAAATPGEARNGRNAAIGIGIGAGVLAGAAIASANNGYYGSGYYGEPGYAYGPSYDQGYYAYEPAYVQPGPNYYYSGGSRNRTRNCTSSPGSMNFGANC